jgi:tetratricopeptide (TPR) repeat protein
MAAQKSLEIWQNLGDSMQVANLHKYKGFLLSQVSLTDQALVEIDRAMELYTLLDYKPGMAVTEFNLAQVYFDSGQTEKSVSYFEKSMKYWRTEGDQKRIFINNIFGIDLYRKAGKDKQAKALIAENEGLISSLAVPQFVIDEFNAVKNGQN